MHLHLLENQVRGRETVFVDVVFLEIPIRLPFPDSFPHSIVDGFVGVGGWFCSLPSSLQYIGKQLVLFAVRSSPSCIAFITTVRAYTTTSVR